MEEEIIYINCHHCDLEMNVEDGEEFFDTESNMYYCESCYSCLIDERNENYNNEEENNNNNI